MKKSFQAGHSLLQQALSLLNKSDYYVDPELVSISQAAMFLSLVGLLFGQVAAQMLLSGLSAPGAPILSFGVGLLPMQIIAFGACLLALSVAGKQLGWQALLSVQTMSLQGIGREVAEVGCLLLLFYPLLLGINYLATIFCLSVGIPTPPQMLEYFAAQSPDISFWLLAFVSIVILAPVSEEIIFRLVFYRALSGIWPRQAAIVTSGLFALLHSRPQFLPGLFLFGLICQAAFIRGGLRQAILLHALYNLCSMLLFFCFWHLFSH